MRPFSFLIAFGAAIWAIGEGWGAFLRAWAAPTWGEAASVAGYLAVFLVTFLYLGFGIYAAERSAGKVRTRIGLYEHILARRAGGRGAGSEDQPTVNRERSATVDTNG